MRQLVDARSAATSASSALILISSSDFAVLRRGATLLTTGGGLNLIPLKLSPSGSTVWQMMNVLWKWFMSS